MAGLVAVLPLAGPVPLLPGKTESRAVEKPGIESAECRSGENLWTFGPGVTDK